MIDRIKNIEALACTLSGVGRSSSAWTEEHGNLVLRISSGEKEWSVCSRLGDDRESAEGLCLDYLLRKMAHAAARCPGCLAHVRRGDDKVRRYRCGQCLRSWLDS